MKNGCLSAYEVVRFVKVEVRYGDSIHPTVLGLVLGLWVSESYVLCPTKHDLCHQISQVFTSFDNSIFLTLYTKILSYQQWEETCMRVGQPSTSYR